MIEIVLRDRRAGLARLAIRLRRRPALGLLAVLAATSLLFLLFPSLDLAVSRHFFDGEGFPLAEDPSLGAIRAFGRRLTIVVIAVGLLGVLVPLLASGRRFGLAPHQALYVLAVYVIGPGLVVNGFFKEVFGRARPREVLEFGGEAVFSKAWVVSDACVGNCSFVSGEAASSATLMALVLALPRGDRPVVALGLAAVAVVVSINRIAFGGHFLSDVLIAWLIVLLVAVVIRPAFFGARGAALDAGVARLSRHATPGRVRLERGAARKVRGLVNRFRRSAADGAPSS